MARSGEAGDVNGADRDRWHACDLRHLFDVVFGFASGMQRVRGISLRLSFHGKGIYHHYKPMSVADQGLYIASLSAFAVRLAQQTSCVKLRAPSITPRILDAITAEVQRGGHKLLLSA